MPILRNDEIFGTVIAFKKNKSVVQRSIGKDPAMIVSNTKISIPPEKRRELLQTLHSLMNRIRHEKGCVSYNFYQDVENENVFIHNGEWETQADLEKHLRSDKFGVLLGALNVLSDMPEIRFNTLAHTAGIEALKKFRC